MKKILIVILTLISIVGYSQDINELKKSARKGNPKAQCTLGEIYYNGNTIKLDSSKNLSKDCEHTKECMEQIRYNIVVAYANKYGMKKDFKKALYWFNKAARQNECVAQYNLGILYCNGCGVKQDYRKAVYWIKRSSKNGNKKALELWKAFVLN